MKNINITINAASGSTVNIYNSNPIPYRTVQDNTGLLHTFFDKASYEEFVEELQSKNK